jgi:hypothetical protein
MAANPNATPSPLLALVAECLGVHPSAPQVGYTRIDWRESLPRSLRVRVRRHTCDCQPIVYELCAAGGLMFVRRSYRSDEILVQESEWLTAPAAEQLWNKILLGHIR